MLFLFILNHKKIYNTIILIIDDALIKRGINYLYSATLKLMKIVSSKVYMLHKSFNDFGLYILKLTIGLGYFADFFFEFFHQFLSLNSVSQNDQ